ncbi:MAG: hypothetical protein E6J91_18135 [Deltaproteobacteria bacterium]|nr:MAG: hypothetical protein E6J91_18135 [Deltaproteobacteria bacterium]
MRFASVRERPRFRQDLIAEAIDEQGARFIDVMAPDGEGVFRFYEAEYALACGMDGERDIAGIVKWAQDELGLTSSHQEVRIVIATLHDLGFIDTGEPREAPAPEVAPGVHVAPPVRPPLPAVVELGAAGGSGPRAAAMPSAPDLALGAAGAGAQRTTRPTPAPPHDVALGAPGTRPGRPTPAPSDVSVDLADHMAVRPDDVKEAVRASRVMAAVEVPTEVDERPTARAGAVEPALERPELGRPMDIARSPDLLRSPESRPPEARPPESRPPEARPPDSRPEIRVGKSPPSRQPVVAKPPVELPPPVSSGGTDRTQKSPPPPEARPSVSPALIVVAIIVVLGAGAFLVWKYVLDKPTAGVDTTTTSTAPPVKPAPPAPPPAPPPTAKVELEIKENDTIIVRLSGDRPLEGELTALRRDKKKLEDLIDAATKRRDAARAAGNKAAEAAASTEINDRQKALNAKEAQVANKSRELESFLVRAPAGGVFTQAAKNGAKLPADAPVGTIQRDAIPTATFHVGNTRSFASNAGVEVAIGKGELRLTCTVVDVGTDTVKVTCPPDPELTNGTDVTLKTPTATAPEAPEPPPAKVPAAPGSAAGTPETPASGSAPAGSATGGTAPAGTAGSGAAPQ